MSLNGTINLMKYNGARKVAIGGQKGIFIPVAENPTIYAEGKGAYASIRIVEKESTFDDRHYTHFVSASLSKKKREELEAQGYDKEAMYAVTPILGNLETYDAQPAGESYEEAEAVEVGGADDNGKDDLPF